MKKIVIGSRLSGTTQVTSPDGSTTTTKNVYWNTTSDDCIFQSNEPLQGKAVTLTEKKAGTKYTRPDGTEGVVAKDGYLLDQILGDAQNMRASIAAAEALKELNDFKF